MDSPLTVHHRPMDKATCNEIFRDNPLLKDHLIPTFKVGNAQDVMNYVTQYSQVALKPNQGHKGFGIKFIRKKRNSFIFLNEDGSKEVLEKDAFLTKVNHLLGDRNYHIQPEIKSHLTGTEYPFVIRSYMGRGREGRWFNLFNYSAMDYLTDGVVNVSQGAALQFFPNFLERQFEKEEAQVFSDKLQRISFEFVKTYQNRIDEDIDAIGIDYIVDTKGHIYMVEINYYPGTRPNSDICTVNYVRFAYYLYHKKLAAKNKI